MDELRRSLFLVEDTQDDEELSLRAISNCGVSCEVEVVRHGGEALRLLISPEGPAPDLIVLDFHLPELNGLDILRELRRHEKTRAVPVVILNAMGSEREMSQCLEAGANSCVQKPLDVLVYLDQVGLIVRYWLTVHKRPEPTPSWAHQPLAP